MPLLIWERQIAVLSYCSGAYAEGQLRVVLSLTAAAYISHYETSISGHFWTFGTNKNGPRRSRLC